MASTGGNCCALYDQHEPLIRAIARDFLQTESHQDFDDLLQAGRIALLRVSHRFDPKLAAETSPTAFVRTVLKNAMYNEIRRLKRQRRHPRALGTPKPVPLETDVPDIEHDAAMISIEEHRQFDQWKSRLPNRDRIIIESAACGLPQRETANTLGVTQPYISQRYRRLTNQAKAALTRTL